MIVTIHHWKNEIMDVSNFVQYIVQGNITEFLLAMDALASSKEVFDVDWFIDVKQELDYVW